jgi:hypothetical protein
MYSCGFIELSAGRMVPDCVNEWVDGVWADEKSKTSVPPAPALNNGPAPRMGCPKTPVKIANIRIGLIAECTVFNFISSLGFNFCF